MRPKIFVLDKASMPHHVRLEITLLREDPIKVGKKKKLAEAQLEVEFPGEEPAKDAFQMISYVLAGWEREIQAKATKTEMIATDKEETEVTDEPVGPSRDK